MIFYFSATGNSLYAADKLGTVLNEKLVDIADAMQKKEFDYQVEENEKVGFVFPVYFYGAPTIVADFASRLTIKGNNNPYIFSIITCGDSIAGADQQFAGILAQRGYAVSSTFPLIMPGNYVFMYDSPSPAEQKTKLDNADKQIITIISAIKQNKTDGYSSGAVSRLITAAIYPIYKNRRKTAKFYAEDTCIGCGLCERVCPIGAIKMNNKKPEWVDKQCVHCVACINRCPVAAIQYGKGTKKRRRFVNPILK